ncbi:hypothetical protein CHH48_08155 [Terribacillus saccharophilus]|uniref:Uncharacterized protein n=1 Tax=Terribacillus saccharophilus TaxID=361277 RepID=A0ABX4GZG5_9BACI|nr:hypothetical protein CHH50_07250 [Terribacillus saccharophilus]PAE00270.1 hypothetical protein CHH48_08155 [Terribacillus saccharophilus]
MFNYMVELAGFKIEILHFVLLLSITSYVATFTRICNCVNLMPPSHFAYEFVEKLDTYTRFLVYGNIIRFLS